MKSTSFLFVVLAACGGLSSTDEWPDTVDRPRDYLPPPGSGGLLLEGPTDVDSGVEYTWVVRALDLADGVEVHIGWGGEEGPGRCPFQRHTQNLLCMDIDNPARHLASGIASGGEVSFTFTVPNTSRGSVWLQAISLDYANSATSNTLGVSVCGSRPATSGPNANGICSVRQLAHLQPYTDYYLMRDLDAAWVGPFGPEPYGSVPTGATLVGTGFHISGLQASLFEDIAAEARVADLVLESDFLNGSNGALLARTSHGVVEHVTFSGSVDAAYGGLIGEMFGGRIQNVYGSVFVSGTGEFSHVGGLVGMASIDPWQAGPLATPVIDSVEIDSSSYVSAGQYIGGIVGRLEGTLSNSVSRASVNGMLSSFNGGATGGVVGVSKRLVHAYRGDR